MPYGLLVLILAACAHVPTADGQGEARIVNTTQGPVRGYREDDLFIFYSIPYATAPTGRDKFKAPLPGPVWVDPLEAIDKGIFCPQLPSAMPQNQQEDCLIATVYVPATDQTNLPVLVYTHGGGYLVGSSNNRTPKHLVASQKIIAVTFNYRLGIHGFLCLGTEGAPGNAAMKDIVALLRWVKENIASFGGNADDVTIAGSSAGASAVDLVLLSESASGLFNKVITESGNNVALWSVQLDPIQTAKDYARQVVGFDDVDDIDALEEFYRTAPMDTLLQLGDYREKRDSSIGFVSCIERDTGVERFLVDAPVNILSQGNHNKVPMLYGFTEMEGLYRVGNGIFDIWKDLMEENFSEFLPADLKFESEQQKEQVAIEIKQFYFGNSTVSTETIYEYINYFTDVMFAYGALKSVRLQVEAGNDNIYLYKYSFDAEELAPVYVEPEVRGATHTAQSWAVYDVNNESEFSERTRNMKTVMRELWINFITTGTPVPAGSTLPAWPATGANPTSYMSLDETLEMREAPFENRTQFWDGIYEQYLWIPEPPTSSASSPHSHVILVTAISVLMYIV